MSRSGSTPTPTPAPPAGAVPPPAPAPGRPPAPGVPPDPPSGTAPSGSPAGTGAPGAASAVRSRAGSMSVTRPGSLLATFARGHWLETVPGRIRLQAAVALAAVAALLTVLTLAIGNARDGVQTIGHDAGPQVVATGNLFFALSDMDAQVSDVLLIGRDHDLGIGHDESLRLYDERRREAGQALVQAAQLAGQDAERQRTVREVMAALGRYERLVGEALVLDRMAAHPAGEPPGPVVDAHRQATDLMRMELLPLAYNLTLDSGATVRQEYEDKQRAVQSGQVQVGLAGVVLLAVLVAVQVSLARGFRRTINPALALATVLTLALAVAGIAQLSAQSGHLRTAKEDGFDSMLTLSRARAISHSAFADESRYLLDPRRADTYEQTYFDKALSVLYIDAGDRPLNLETYYALLDRKVRSYVPGRDRVDFLGFYADQARKARTAAENRTLARTLAAYGAVIDNDRRMRELAARGDRAGAIELRMGRGNGGAISAFEDYDRALVQQAAVHRGVFDGAIAAADGGLRGWTVLPPAAALVIAGLVLAGLRPRLAEFR
ncbi:hypothetical protein [Actinomadura viridis]|uniref:Secreted protein n=1 Tax=Actinomadura viridis TaxID=58110 RepID=A0A931GMH0_9ACTN|nr:hypothetical protein [Actinomadura viridis]MBG6092000.1 hypothetical protein [Actinomadura viridis]